MNKPEIEVLLVEDDMNDAEMTIRALKKSNPANRLPHAGDGTEALEFLFGECMYPDNPENKGPKVIFPDINMPIVNGKEVLRKIKLAARTSNMPVVMLPSSNDDPEISECNALGVSSYAVKPVDFGDFNEAISRPGLNWKIINGAAI